jgi:hypothetical protein
MYVKTDPRHPLFTSSQYVQTDPRQPFFAPSQLYLCTPVQPPVSSAPVPEWQPTKIRWVDYVNAALNDFLKKNWPDLLKAVIQELGRPERLATRPGRTRRYHRGRTPRC